MTQSEDGPRSAKRHVAIRVGTSGYSFDDWVGAFYPEGLPKKEWLRFYARYFHTLELNTSYYAIPAQRTIQRLCEELPPSYPIMVKANQQTTHKHSDEAIAGEFRERLTPLIENGMLKGVLAQFPWSFRKTPENMAYLVEMVRRTPDVPWFVEFRRREWIVPEVGDLLRNEGIGFVSVDEPQISGMVPPIARHTTPTAYIRFHGRNARDWWQSDPAQGRDRYDYRYTPEELEAWVKKLVKLVGQVDEVFMYFNNCHGGQAAENAAQMRNLLSRLQEQFAADPDSPELSLQ